MKRYRIDEMGLRTMERNRFDQKTRRAPSGAAVPRAELTAALYRALFTEWAEHGFAAVSLERVAARAGAGKAAIYRRWSSRLEFAAEAIWSVGLDMAPVEDCGSLERDILAFLTRLRAVLRHPLVRRILPDLHAESVRSPGMGAIHARVAEARRMRGAALIERAVARGELDDTIDRSIALDCLPAQLYWRMIVTGASVSRTQLAQLAAAIAAELRSFCSADPGRH